MSGHDVIHLRGLEFYAYHGALPEEQVLGQKFIIDMDLFADLSRAGISDHVKDTIHYGEVYNVIKVCVRDDKHQLIEHLAEKIARTVLSKFSCDSVRVEVHKPQAPVAGIFRDVSVEIWRQAGEKA
ncbi:dihydroneopterin aldolase [Desulfosporosinus acidiphilus SJ4]|uniref:7,8-dihydroneopterin aldolase n=1 Tax=Desulfosporosinus acidiphilus (strain DSM 22704 / JCM 16185 / SJ4) TaxID=646529 RepID=I4D074_DESAJ|nr:dihydroneopterin aldolase [Desulfosporosinus acidiphilus]AFM39198.1 dihydroneopterin aldolase [Desulfosporosinus acidiphilus SJ4]